MDYAERKANEWLSSHSERLKYWGRESATGIELFESLSTLIREPIVAIEKVLSCNNCIDDIYCDHIVELKKILGRKSDGIS